MKNLLIGIVIGFMLAYTLRSEQVTSEFKPL